MMQPVTPAQLEDTKRWCALDDRPWIRLEVERRHRAGLYCMHHDPQAWLAAAAAAAAAAADDAAFDAAMEVLECAKGCVNAMEEPA